MFTRITGVLLERSDERVLVDVGGLGYEIILPPCVGAALEEAINDRVTLEMYSVLAIEGNSGRFTYYGFRNGIEREFFEALLSVASIGPRSAARAFSRPMADIAAAIDRGDHTFLKTLPGIGQQKARDIVAKLQGKVARFMLIRQEQRDVAVPIPDYAAEALDVLLQLGYKRAEAETLVTSAIETTPAKDAEAVLAAIYAGTKKKS